MSRVFLDANVIYPAVLRHLLLGIASEGVFVPLWSERVLAEWQHAALRRGEGAEAGAGLARVADWPGEMVEVPPGSADGLSLPDPADVHVLAAAIAGGADVLLTANLRDFPIATLARHGLTRRSPDELLSEALSEAPDIVRRVAEEAHRAAEARAGRELSRRALFKRLRLSRFAKALDA